MGENRAMHVDELKFQWLVVYSVFWSFDFPVYRHNKSIKAIISAYDFLSTQVQCSPFLSYLEFIKRPVEKKTVKKINDCFFYVSVLFSKKSRLACWC